MWSTCLFLLQLTFPAFNLGILSTASLIIIIQFCVVSFSILIQFCVVFFRISIITLHVVVVVFVALIVILLLNLGLQDCQCNLFQCFVHGRKVFAVFVTIVAQISNPRDTAEALAKTYREHNDENDRDDIDSDDDDDSDSVPSLEVGRPNCPYLSELPFRRGLEPPPNVRLQRHALCPYDYEVPRPAAMYMLNPHLTVAPDADDHLLVFWRAAQPQPKIWPNDFAVGLLNRATGETVPHNLPLDIAGYHQPVLSNTTGFEQSIYETELQRTKFIFVQSIKCLKVKDLRTMWWKDRLYMLTTTNCGRERHQLIPLVFAFVRESSTGPILRWRLYIDYKAVRYFVHTPMRDHGPSFSNRIDNGPYTKGPPKREKNWAVIPYEEGVIAIRHLCPFSPLRSGHIGLVGPRRIIRLNNVSRLAATHNINMEYVRTARPAIPRSPIPASQDGIELCVGDASTPPDRSLSNSDNATTFEPYSSQVWRSPTSEQQLEFHRPIVAPFGVASESLSQAKRDALERLCVLDGPSRRDPYRFLDLASCLERDLFGIAWRGGSQLLEVRVPDGETGQYAQEKRFLGTAHIKSWQSNETVAFYWHFLFVIGLSGPSTSPTVRLVITSRLFRFHARLLPLREFNVGLLHLPKALLFTYGQGVAGQRAYTALISTQYASALVDNLIAFPSPPLSPSPSSPSVRHLDSIHHSIFTTPLQISDVLQYVPRDSPWLNSGLPKALTNTTLV